METIHKFGSLGIMVAVLIGVYIIVRGFLRHQKRKKRDNYRSQTLGHDEKLSKLVKDLGLEVKK